MAYYVYENKAGEGTKHGFILLRVVSAMMEREFIRTQVIGSVLLLPLMTHWPAGVPLEADDGVWS